MTWSPLRDAGHAGTDVDDDAGALVTEDRGKQALGIGARARELVGVADAGRLDLDQHFAGLRTVELDGFDLERSIRGECDGSLHLHEECSFVGNVGILRCTPFSFATWVAIASISGGERQS